MRLQGNWSVDSGFRFLLRDPCVLCYIAKIADEDIWDTQLLQLT